MLQTRSALYHCSVWSMGLKTLDVFILTSALIEKILFCLLTQISCINFQYAYKKREISSHF